MEETKKEEALAKTVREPLAFIPKNLDDAWRVADLLSKASILPDALRGKPHDVLVTVMTGSELGLSPMQSIRSISVVKGRGYLDALLKVALVKQSPECLYLELVSSTAEKCVYKTKRRGEGEVVMEYGIADAMLAGLTMNDNYKKRPKLMLRRRCASEICDEVYPDIVRGIDGADDLPAEREVNAKPATFAPPPPVPEEAVVVPPSPPPTKAKKKLTVVDVPSKPSPEEERAANEAAERDPEAAGLPSPTPPGALDAVGLLLKLADAKSEADIDALAPLAQKIQGPDRPKLSAAFKARRNDIAKSFIEGGAA